MVDATKQAYNQQIITLSFGPLCNDIVHYTYCLDQLDHNVTQSNVLFHVTSTKQLIPRLVAVDFKSSIGTFRNVNKKLSNVDIDTIHSVTNEFTQLYNNRQIVNLADDTSKNSDHILDTVTINYNDHTNFTLPIHCIDNITQFSDFNYITQGLSNNNSALNTYIDNIIDSVRYWAEQCDTLSAFHVYVDIDSGWAGIAINVIQQLHDEFGYNVPIIVFGISNKLDPNHSDYDKHVTRKLINRCIAMRHINEYAALYIPLDADTIELPNNTSMSTYDLNVHTFANIIHTITIPYRLQSNFCTIDAYIKHLSPLNGLKIIGINAIIPITTDNQLLAQRQTRSMQTDTRSATINHTHFTALWKSSNTTVQHISPFTQRIERGETRIASRRNARLLDESDSDIDSEKDNIQHNHDMLLSELIVCRGLTNEQQMNLTINYDTLAPSGNRVYSYVTTPTQSPYNNKQELLPAVYCIYNAQSIDEWLLNNSNAFNSILGSNTVHNLQGTDTVDVRQVIQQFIKDGMARSDLIDVAAGIRSIADEYIDLTG